MPSNRRKRFSPTKEGLIALLKDKNDFGILQEQGWYRVPVASAPRPWPPRWIGFYMPKPFGPDAYTIRYYGLVKNIQLATRRELFPNEIESALSQKQYYRVTFHGIEERPTPIPSHRPRRLIFIPTTWAKFELAEQINDLFNDSPLEDLLWARFKQMGIPAERQWQVDSKQQRFRLDFALFCKQKLIDIEVDGDTWHADPDRIPLDNQRNNALGVDLWTVLRFNGRQIREQMDSYCLPSIQEAINTHGGLSDDGLVSRVFYPDSNVQQLNLFEDGDRGYEIEAGLDEHEVE